jgi:hypothetical protein
MWLVPSNPTGLSSLRRKEKIQEEEEQARLPQAHQEKSMIGE